MRNFVAINVPAGRLPLRETIPAVRDLLEGGRDVRVQLRLMANIDLETIRMRIGAPRMANLGPACDDQRADPCSVLQRYDTVDCAREDALVGGAVWLCSISALAGRKGGDAIGNQSRLGLRLGEWGAASADVGQQRQNRESGDSELHCDDSMSGVG